MLPDWTNHLKDPDEKKRFQAYIMNSRSVLDRQLELLRRWDAELTDKEISEDAYDSPSWAAKQADINGYRRALRRIRTLITLDPKENK